MLTRSTVAWDVTANISFGRHYGFIDQEKDVDNLITDSTKGLKYFAPVSQIPWIDKLLDKNPLIRIGPKPTLTGVMYAFGVCASYQAELDAQKDDPSLTKPKPAEHSLDKYIRLKSQYPDLVNDAQIVNWLMLNILAGGDTTSAIMRAVVYHLSKHPQAYTQLTDELDTAKISFPAQWKEINSLPYLDAVIREAMRLNPGLAMIPERIVPASGLTLPDGRFIPAGTKVGINPAVATYDVGVFGSDATVFNSDRWLPQKSESEADFKARYKKMKEVGEFIFGAGGRVCMGRYLATLEIWKFIATLYGMFDFRLVDPMKEWGYHNAWFVYTWDMPCYVKRREKGEKV
jgi:cytochrome P450